MAIIFIILCLSTLSSLSQEIDSPCGLPIEYISNLPNVAIYQPVPLPHIQVDRTQYQRYRELIDFVMMHECCHHEDRERVLQMMQYNPGTAAYNELRSAAEKYADMCAVRRLAHENPDAIRAAVIDAYTNPDMGNTFLPRSSVRAAAIIQEYENQTGKPLFVGDSDQDTDDEVGYLDEEFGWCNGFNEWIAWSTKERDLVELQFVIRDVDSVGTQPVKRIFNWLDAEYVQYQVCKSSSLEVKLGWKRDGGNVDFVLEYSQSDDSYEYAKETVGYISSIVDTLQTWSFLNTEKLLEAWELQDVSRKQIVYTFKNPSDGVMGGIQFERRRMAASSKQTKVNGEGDRSKYLYTTTYYISRRISN